MVCMDANTRKSRAVNPLVLETEEEKAIYAMGEGKSCLKCIYLIF